jgi:type I restriction enzyme S subunit
VSELPAGWAEARLPEMITSAGVFNDGDWVESKDQDPNGDVRLIQLADIGDGRYRDRSARFLTNQKALELGCTYLMPGDVLIARMPDPLGRACIFPGDPRAAVTVVDVCVVRPGDGGVNPRWLVHMVNAPQIRGAIAAYQKGTTRKRISRGNLALVPFSVPPLAEQERIVAAIDEQFSRLDAGVAALERVIGPLTNTQGGRVSQLRSSILATAFSGKLVPQDPNDEPTAVLLERAATERASSDDRKQTKGRRGYRKVAV